MKKNFLYITIAATILGGFSSCSDFLDRIPETELSDGSFWKTPKDAEMFTADLYRTLPGANSGDIDGDIESDNAVHGIKWAAGNVSKGIYDPSDFGWSGDYGVIRACNILLEKIDLIPDYPEADKNATIAEARFFRAYTYFGLAKNYGDVPYIESTLAMGDLEGITRTPVATVLEKLMADFDFAITNLPVAWGADKYGRITKGAAAAMKARAALYFGQFEVASTASKSVIDSGEYELFGDKDTYKELFWERQERCKEAVLVRQFKNPDMTNYIIGWGAFPSVGWGGLNPTQSLVDAFECSDGSTIDQSTIYDDKDPFSNRDPRLETCILHNGEERYNIVLKTAPLKSSGNNGVGQHGDATATGYYNDKYLDLDLDAARDGWDMGKDWHVIRYAEVLLTYAEAKNEVTGLDQSALDAVNAVRERVGMPALQTTNASEPTYVASQDDLRQRIRNEWRVEFALEGGKRKWDIRRWDIAEKVLNEPFLGMKYELVDSPDADPKDAGKVCIFYQGENIKLTGSRYAAHNKLMPIPQSEIDLNPGLTQNPGY